jgi:Arc/MetJ-type ribon-helix-helix transcriptional regulator
MNVNLGAPYEAIIKQTMGRGYASSRTEVIRQALLFYEEKMEDDEVTEEEVRLVNKGIEYEMKKVRSGKERTYTLEEVKKKLGV